MDPDLIDVNLVFAKTAAGEEAMLQRTRVVQRNVRMVLILVDGNATVAELCDKTGNAQLTQSALLELENDGFIERRVDTASVWGQSKTAAERETVVSVPPLSEFSTFGEKQATTGVSSAPPGVPETQIIAVPERGGSESSPTPSTLTPPPSLTAPDSGTAFPSLPASESPPRSSADAATVRPSLRERWQTLARRVWTEGRPDLSPLRRRRRRWSLTWPMGLLLCLLLVTAVLSLVALFFPYARYLPEVEAALTQSTGRSAKVGAMRIGVYPRPGLLLDDVRLGDEGAADELRIATLRLQPAISTLLSSTLLFREAELSDLTLSAEVIVGLSQMLESAARQSAGSGVLQVSIVNAQLSFGELVVGGMGGELALSAERLLDSVSLRSRDKSLQVQLKPTARGVAVHLAGLGWRPAKDSPYFFDSLELQGEIAGAEFVIDSVEARIFDGLLRGAGILRASTNPSISGELAFERIDAKKFAEALAIGVQLEGESKGRLKFSANSESWSTLFSALQASGNFTIHRGQIGGLDLPEAVRRASADPLTLGGATRFEELSGTINLTPGASRFSRLALNAGLMQSDGQLEMSRDLQLRGRMDVTMRGQEERITVPVLISGSLRSPLTQTR